MSIQPTRYMDFREGFKYTKENVSIVIGLKSSINENHQLDEEHLAHFVEGFIQFHRGLQGKGSYSASFQEVLTPMSFSELETISFYKYTPTETLNNFIRKGKFQFGSIEYYRKIENAASQDDFEGFSMLVISTLKNQVITSVLSGFNYYILSGTTSISNSHPTKFGRSIYKIENLHNFARSVQKAIGARRYYFNKISYSDLKLFSVNSSIENAEWIKNADLSEEMFDFMYQNSFMPSLFCKPNRFQDEDEIRLVFEMPADCKKFLRITNLGLLDNLVILD